MAQEEIILSTINKCLEIKDIISEASNIKKSLKLKDAEVIKEITEKTKTIVDKLYKHVGDIRNKFYKECKLLDNTRHTIEENEENDVEQMSKDTTLQLDNTCITDSFVEYIDSQIPKPNEKEIDSHAEKENAFEFEKSKEKEEVAEKTSQQNKEETKDDVKPRIKVVDFSKLCAPGPENALDFSSLKQKKSVSFDSSIIILTDSEEDSPRKLKRKTNSETTTKSCMKKTKAANYNGTDKTDESGSRNNLVEKESICPLDSSDSDGKLGNSNTTKDKKCSDSSDSEEKHIKRRKSRRNKVGDTSDKETDKRHKRMRSKNKLSLRKKYDSDSCSDDEKYSINDSDSDNEDPKSIDKEKVNSNYHKSKENVKEKIKSDSKKDTEKTSNNKDEQMEDKTNSSSDSETTSSKWQKKLNLDAADGSIKLKLKKNPEIFLNAKLSDTSDENIEDEASKKPFKKYKSGPKSRRHKMKTHPNCELCVALPLIQCENLKETYLNNKEILDIKRLTNMESLKLKRSRVKTACSSKSSDTEKPKSKKQKEMVDPEQMSETNVDAGADDLLQEIACTDAPEPEPVTSEVLDIKDLSDAEGQKASSDENEETHNKKTAKQLKEQKLTDEGNCNQIETVDESEKTDASEDEEEIGNKKNNKEKEKWKNDKLLTAKLDSTDSEEEFEKFKKKKNKENDDSGSNSDDKKKDKKGKSKKTRKRVKIVIDSDDSNDAKSSGEEFQRDSEKSSSEDEKVSEPEEEGQEKSKRKRIKPEDSTSDEDDKATRKQIRRVMGKDSLSDTTKKAEADERERKARIAEKQKKYNLVFESKDLDATVDKLILDFNEESNEELLRVDDHLVKKLKPHQASGIKFMWEACYESVERAQKTKGSGCILAHCMGLGKTLQVITLAHTLLINSDTTKVERVMVVCPVNTVLNWKNEFKKWLPKEDEFDVYELVSCKQNYERQYQVTDWYRNGGVLIIGYNMFRTLSNPDNKRISRKMRTAFQEGLVDPGPDLVVCDEGHLLKNEKTNLSISMNRIKSLRRIVLTGTPLQNNLKEYWCMVQFVKPNLLGTYKEYLNRFVNPITNGQYTDSTQHDIQIMRKRAHVLHKMLDGIVQRRDYAVLEPYLPPKHEYVLFVSLTDVQVKIYEHYINNFARQNDGSNRTSFLFTDFQQLQRICTHPRVLLDKSIEDKEKKEKLDEDEDSEGSLKDFIDDGNGSESEAASTSDGSKSGSEAEPVVRKRTTRATRARRRENGDSDSDIEMLPVEAKKEWWQEFCDGEQLNNVNNSGKMFLLFEILKECEAIGDKILIFSQSLYTLNCIEYFLNRIDEATQAGNTESVGGHTGSWSIGLDYFRLDGSSSCENRATWCNMFNSPKNTRARLFLISTKAGGLGINLTAANRVIIFDVSWNPSHDIQSIYRVYRFGQTKPSYVYRFVAYGTMEMKIYERQVTKQAISKRVIDEQQIDRHYNQNDLQELYKCDLKPIERPTPLVPKDVLLGEMLHTYASHIYKYHEHQSLLENKEEEGLNEEERKAAWEEFENEKVNRYANHNTGSNNISTQSIALALTNIVKRDNPDWTDVQIKGVIPALVQQLQVQLQAGDVSMYQRVQHEIRLMQAQQAQKLREQYYQQQMMRMLQAQQQQQGLMGNMNINSQQLFNLLSQGSNNTSSNDVIELN
ncbi:unnamed protein product [Brassicogethes aeneus]|uniref:Transcriptional regulator ATRX homolog n=1 Tax=Brassicogethes aeneus TaxID=1431903 RepID=A0A9P0AYQ7_BRAAE|nr:unnamed protein product [Brassicogethes aeneus]